MNVIHAKFTKLIETPLTANGVRTLTPLSEYRTRIGVIWDIDMSNIPIFGRGFAKDNFMKTTEEALKRYAQENARYSFN